MVAAGAETLPTAYQNQLADGGRLIIPIGPPSHQQMFRITRRGLSSIATTSAAFGFVPLVGSESN